MVQSREIHLVAYPEGLLAASDMELVKVDVPALKPGQVLVKNVWMSVDAGQRSLMRGGETSQIADLPAHRLQLNEPIDGQAIGQIVESLNDELPVGTYVLSNMAWREYFVAGGTTDGFAFSVISDPVDPLQLHLSLLSPFGATAYFHVTEGADVRAGETILISTAAGSVGSLAAQIARIAGCRVIGTAGTDEKVAWLKDELGVDDAVNYHREDLAAELRRVAPEGIDVYLDLAGGKQLEVAIDVLKPRGRIVKIGDTASYDTGVPSTPSNLFEIVLKRLDLLGRSIFDYITKPEEMARAYTCLARWHAEGKIRVFETVYDGIETAAEAQIDLFAGNNIGKVLVRIADLP